MRERITFVHPQGADIDPKLLKVTKTEFQGPSVKTTREDRLTIGLDALPSELASLLQGYRDLNIRWASPLTYDTIEPFTSRLSPGLHVFYTPVGKNGDQHGWVLPVMIHPILHKILTAL